METPSLPVLCRSVRAKYRRLAGSSARAFVLPVSCCPERKSTGFPVEVLNAHPVEFALISHSGIAHQNDDVTKEIVRFLSPLATESRREQFPFRVNIESE